jgi:hypothetical protein
MKRQFTAEQFTPTEWNSAEDKAKFANHFVRFVESGYKPSLFEKWFYTRLSNTFGHIAHYDRGGFYATFFETLRDQLRFLEITAGNYGLYSDRSGGICGDPQFTYSDVERALRNWARENQLVEKAKAALGQETETAERAELARLQAKYSAA